MAAGNWIMFDSAKEFIADGTIDLDSDTFKVALFTNALTPNRSTQSELADLSNEVANGNGYATGGVALTGVTWGQTGGVATFDANDPSWTASGASIGPFRIAVIYSDTSVGDKLLCYCVLDSADITISDGATFEIRLHANGIFQLSDATS